MNAVQNPVYLIASIFSVTFVVGLLDAAISDFRSFRIPNRIPLLLLASFPPVAILDGFTVHDWWIHAAVAASLFAISIVLFAGRLWGGGDAKLLPAVGLWIGLNGLSRFLVVMSAAGCVLACAAMLIRVLPLATSLRSRQIPYGLAIAAGGLDWWIGVTWR
ncbi:MAG: prepilin peptidase [Alphaproteobacteria bacterium]|nr:prepilin peptidase [Alphaproteobacteria bacterium]